MKCIQKDRQPYISHMGVELISVAGNEVPGCHMQFLREPLVSSRAPLGADMAKPLLVKDSGGRNIAHGGMLGLKETEQWLDNAKKSLERGHQRPHVSTAPAAIG